MMLYMEVALFYWVPLAPKLLSNYFVQAPLVSVNRLAQLLLAIGLTTIYGIPGFLLGRFMFCRSLLGISSVS